MPRRNFLVCLLWGFNPGSPSLCVGNAFFLASIVRCAGARHGLAARARRSSSRRTQARHPLPLDSLIDGYSFFLLNTRVSKGRSRGLSFRSSPPWFLGVFASLAPKSVWRGVKTSSRFFGVADHASSIVIPFCAILFLGSLVSILRSTLAPGTCEGALLLSRFCFVRYFSRAAGFCSAFCAGSRDARWGLLCSLAGVSRGDAVEGSCHDFGVFESFAQTGKGKESVPALPGFLYRK